MVLIVACITLIPVILSHHKLIAQLFLVSYETDRDNRPHQRGEALDLIFTEQVCTYLSLLAGSPEQ